MSLLPLNYGTQLSLALNAIEIHVVDVTYENVAGIDTQTVKARRKIDAAVDTSSGRKLEQIFGGPVSDGDLAIFPLKDELYYLDAFGERETRKQSFILYDGINYRVLKGQNFKPMSGTKVYQAERHITQDVL